MDLVPGITEAEAILELQQHAFNVEGTVSDPLLARDKNMEMTEENTGKQGDKVTSTQGIQPEKKVNRTRTFCENTGTDSGTTRSWFNKYNGQLTPALDAYFREQQNLKQS